VNWNIIDSQIVPGSSMEQKNFLGVGHSQKSPVRVDAEVLISVQSVPPDVKVDLKLLESGNVKNFDRSTANGGVGCLQMN
jgi:hypothetical protein